MSSHRNVCGEVIVDIGVQVSGVDMGRCQGWRLPDEAGGQSETDGVVRGWSKTEIGLEVWPDGRDL